MMSVNQASTLTRCLSDKETRLTIDQGTSTFLPVQSVNDHISRGGILQAPNPNTNFSVSLS